jgi:hypothetical protein
MTQKKPSNGRSAAAQSLVDGGRVPFRFTGPGRVRASIIGGESVGLEDGLSGRSAGALLAVEADSPAAMLGLDVDVPPSTWSGHRIAAVSLMERSSGWYYPSDRTLQTPSMRKAATLEDVKAAGRAALRNGWRPVADRVREIVRDAGLMSVGTVPVGRRIFVRADSGDELDPVRAIIMGDPDTAWKRPERADGRAGPGVVMLAFDAGGNCNVNAAEQIMVAAVTHALVERLRASGYVVGAIGVMLTIGTGRAPGESAFEGGGMFSFLAARPGAPAPVDALSGAAATLALFRVGGFRALCLWESFGWRVCSGLGHSVRPPQSVMRAACRRHGIPDSVRIVSVGRPRDGSPDAARQMMLDSIQAVREG